MPKISKKHLRYRTKEQISEDIRTVLNADLSYGTRFAVFSEITWIWSEFQGKYRGCPWWSEKAIAGEDLIIAGGGLIHEHIIPKKILIQKLMNMKNSSTEEIRDFLEKNCIGVIITKEEDKKLRNAKLTSSMPVDWDEKDIWARYKEVGINAIYRKLVQ